MVTALLVVLGFVAGLLGALTGIGGGVILTPILALHFGIPIRQAIGLEPGRSDYNFCGQFLRSPAAAHHRHPIGHDS